MKSFLDKIKKAFAMDNRKFEEPSQTSITSELFTIEAEGNEEGEANKIDIYFERNKPSDLILPIIVLLDVFGKEFDTKGFMERAKASFDKGEEYEEIIDGWSVSTSLHDKQGRLLMTKG